jgi:hypothetical protein
MKLKIFDDIDRNVDNLMNIFQSLTLMGILIIVIMGVSAIAYSIWESLIGRWGFHVDRNTYPIVGAIILCAVQLHGKE